MKHIVVTGDIINSRNNRFSKEAYLSKVEAFNRENRDDIEVEFSVLKGDEIQGVAKYGCNIFRVIRRLKVCFKPYELKIGLGIGSINEALEKADTSWQLNGQAFFRARDAIDEISSKKKKNINYKVAVKTGDSILDERINLFYSFISDTIDKWGDELLTILKYAEKGLTHEEIAMAMMKKEQDEETLKTLRSGITKKIQRADWYKVELTEKILNGMLFGGDSGQ